MNRIILIGLATAFMMSCKPSTQKEEGNDNGTTNDRNDGNYHI
jgi:hypothetical protein